MVIVKIFTVNPYPANSFLSWKCCLLFTSVAYIQKHLKPDFIMEANTMNPDQTAPKEQSNLGPYCM